MSQCLATRPGWQPLSAASALVHRIVGGTGRFDGATGELDTEAVNAGRQGPDDLESHGWIRYGASKRAN